MEVLLYTALTAALAAAVHAVIADLYRAWRRAETTGRPASG